TKTINVAVSESLVFSDSVNKSIPVDISESITISDSISDVKNIRTGRSESLVFSDSVSVAKSVTQSISESLVLSDSISDTKTINVAVSESLVFSDSVSVGLLSIREISENIEFVDSLRKSIGKQLDESVILSDEKAINSDTTVVLTESLPLTNEQLDSTSVGRISDSGSSQLASVVDVKVFQKGSNYYAVAVGNENALQIVDVTDPENPTALGSVSDSVTRLLQTPKGLDIIQIASSYYAVVAGFGDDGIEIIDITNVNSPSSVSRVADDGTKLLDGASDVAITNIGDYYYAVVASYYDEGIEIIDITNPSTPNSVGRVGDNGDRELSGAQNVVVYQSGNNHYAIVSGSVDDGIQVINITNPASPSIESEIEDTASLYLNFPRGIGINSAQQKIIVSSYDENGVQVIGISNISSISAGEKMVDDATRELDGPWDVEMFSIGSANYAIVSAERDDGLSIIQIPTSGPLSYVADIEDDDTKLLQSPKGIDVFRNNSIRYAIIAGSGDSGLEIIRLSTGNTADQVSVKVDRIKEITESLIFGDAVSVGKLATANVSESLLFTDSIVEVKTIGVALSEDVQFADAVSIAKAVTQAISES
ncbi:MAG: hypothetical protein VW683_16505, partial [Betaproteobacteria bacterium]